MKRVLTVYKDKFPIGFVRRGPRGYLFASNIASHKNSRVFRESAMAAIPKWARHGDIVWDDLAEEDAMLDAANEEGAAHMRKVQVIIPPSARCGDLDQHAFSGAIGAGDY